MQRDIAHSNKICDSPVHIHYLRSLIVHFALTSVELAQKRTYTEFLPSSDIEDVIPCEASLELVNLGLETLHKTLQDVGYSTIFDACVDELRCLDPATRRSVKNMKSRDVMADILKAYADSAPMGPRPLVADQLCELAEKVYWAEINHLERNREITGSAKGLNADELENFAFGNAGSAIENDAPRLLKLLTSLSEKIPET